MTGLIKVRDAAALLNLSECTVFRVERAEIPHVRIGRNIRFRPEALEKFLGRRERAGEGGR